MRTGEAQIIARVRAGDAEAYAELVRAHAPIAHRTARLLGAGADAEDVVQDAFVKAYLALGRFQSEAAFRPWLLRIVAHETSNAVRSARRRRTAADREGALLAGAEPVIPESADPAAVALAGERRARLLAALEELSEPQRRVVIYRYLLDLDEGETAEALGWPRGTVKSRLSRALRRLERLLGPSETSETERETADEMEWGGAGDGRGGAARRAAGARAGAGDTAVRRAVAARRVAGGRRGAGGRRALGGGGGRRPGGGRGDAGRAGAGPDRGPAGAGGRRRPDPGGAVVAAAARPGGRAGPRAGGQPVGRPGAG
ncbi:RNA polymerase sigma-70 factor (ECF subfamily) [Streptomyces rapamycinicus]|uniref:RNA polymerase sigma factor n=1 Tax=Streptomyces rapamycinicus TaxID=1226757 RepID=A0ABR6LR37_9ACTN|nr:RNA polymerase sigma-70 factor (ECF subfamily) [Streptomyces rapamycinicus]